MSTEARPTDDDMLAAYDAGIAQAAGADRLGIDCPYSLTDTVLRTCWDLGFAAGREATWRRKAA